MKPETAGIQTNRAQDDHISPLIIQTSIKSNSTQACTLLIATLSLSWLRIIRCYRTHMHPLATIKLYLSLTWNYFQLVTIKLYLSLTWNYFQPASYSTVTLVLTGCKLGHVGSWIMGYQWVSYFNLPCTWRWWLLQSNTAGYWNFRLCTWMKERNLRLVAGTELPQILTVYLPLNWSLLPEYNMLWPVDWMKWPRRV